MRPIISINVKNIKENILTIKDLCDKNNINLSLVVKLTAGDKKLVKELIDTGINNICDSRIKNLKTYKDINIEKWLIRLPMKSEVKDVIKYCDVSLNSEITTIKALDKEAKRQNKKHKIILMYELGDLREGMSKEELDSSIPIIKELKNIELYGIGCNLSCYGEIIPTEENMKEFNDLVLYLENKHNIKFKVISGGNSSSFKLLQEGKLPKKINNLRIGEAIYLGRIPCHEIDIPFLHNHNFTLKTEIIEIKEKPSIPWGECGLVNSFSMKSHFIDRGIRKRAIIALGRQDTNIDGITPIDDKAIILGASSDHTILDIHDCKKKYKVGDTLEFNLNYSAILLLMNNSKYIKKDYRN